MGDDIDMGAVALLRADNTTPGADAFVRTLDKLKEESDVKSIVEGMLMYAQEKGVQEACARALAALASGAQENLNLMIEHGVVQVFSLTPIAKLTSGKVTDTSPLRFLIIYP